MLISVVLPSIAGLWFEMGVLMQMYREFQTLGEKREIKLWRERWDLQIRHGFVLGRGQSSL